MAYVLGIDLGTSYSAAAVGHEDGRVEMFQLGTRSAAIPSLVAIRADGEILVGEAAERRALSEPQRVAREFKRRLGDPVPLVIGGTPYGPEALLAILIRAIEAQVRAELGLPAAHVVITHPASYGPYKLDLLRQAAIQADLPDSTFVSEPVAAAIHYVGLDQVPMGAAIAVYDFGGGTFDATLLEKTATGFEVLGTPEGLDRLGGIDFDEAVFRHVLGALPGLADAVQGSPRDPAFLTALARLREECRRAKEALSADTDATIPVSLPAFQADVRITRAEFEAMIEPRIGETVAVVRRAARTAGIGMDRLERILLVGGTSRIPRIAEAVHSATGRPIAIDVQPKHGVALGAAEVALERSVTAGVPTIAPPLEARISADDGVRGGQASGTAELVVPAASRGPRRRTGRRSVLIAGVAGAVLLALAGGAAAFGLLRGSPATGATDRPGVGVAPTLPPAPTPLPTLQPALHPSAAIERITRSGRKYEVSFSTTAFVPAMGGRHVHFFWDTVQPDQAGAPGTGPYVVYAGSSPFTGLGLDSRPAGATAICMVVANPDHSVLPGSGSCAPLP